MSLVAREENITRAAELLHVTQPTLSRQLMQLEEELGVKLFQRSNHSIRLTEDGMLLRKRAQDIVSLADKTENEFHHKEETVVGEIAIGSGETRNVQSLAEIISRFRKEYPGVRYDLYTANADDIKERLDRGLLDIGLLMEPVDISKYNFVRLEKRERWGVLVRQDSELAQKDIVTPADLVHIPLMLVKRALVQNELANWFGDYYDQIHVIGTYNLINNAAVMVENGIGAALCFKLENAFSNLRFIPLSPAIDTGAVLVWKKN
ncbi:MAG: LysR family transcriptional regulator [Lachnospiraceae bacterium]|nr:LysR family transcriptional regulator [Lachnospiraceae bacterium]